MDAAETTPFPTVPYPMNDQIRAMMRTLALKHPRTADSLERTWDGDAEAIVVSPFDPWLTPEDHYEAMCALMAERAPA